MKKMKIFAVLVLLVSLLAACANNGSSDSEDKKDEGTKTSSEPVEIEFWYGLGSVAGETMESIIAHFNASQDEVVLTAYSTS